MFEKNSISNLLLAKLESDLYLNVLFVITNIVQEKYFLRSDYAIIIELEISIVHDESIQQGNESIVLLLPTIGGWIVSMLLFADISVV